MAKDKYPYVDPETIAEIDRGIEQRLREERLEELAEQLYLTYFRTFKFSRLFGWDREPEDCKTQWRKVAQAAIDYCGKEECD